MHTITHFLAPISIAVISTMQDARVPNIQMQVRDAIRLLSSSRKTLQKRFGWVDRLPQAQVVCTVNLRVNWVMHTSLRQIDSEITRLRPKGYGI